MTKDAARVNKDAAKASKDGAARFVVYVPDEGRQVFNAEQMRLYRDFVFAEATYVNGNLTSRCAG